MKTIKMAGGRSREGGGNLEGERERERLFSLCMYHLHIPHYHEVLCRWDCDVCM